jgi:hypothetical protein
MSASITAPGYWLIASPKASGIVYYTSAGQVSAATGAIYLGATSISPSNLQKAIGLLGVQGLFEVPGGLSALISQAKQSGSALISHTPSGAVWDPTLTAIAAGLGGVVYGAAAGAAGAAGAGAVDVATGAGGATAVGTGEAGVGVGEAAVAAGEGAAAAGLVAGGLTSASELAAIWSWLTTPAKWLRILEFVAGAVLIHLALKSLTGSSGPSVVPTVVKKAVAA